MTKRILLLAVVLLAVVALIAPVSFAADNSNTQTKAWCEQLFAAKKANVDQAIKNGELTPQQGEAWKKHFDEAQQLQAKTGYYPGGGRGFCAQGAAGNQGGCCGGGGCRWNNQTQPQTSQP